jgi:hypothetical protein
MSNEIAIVNQLIDAGANVNIQDITQSTALIYGETIFIQPKTKKLFQ